MTRFSPYLRFTRSQWRAYRRDTPMPLTENDLKKLQGHFEPVSFEEIRDIYLPLSRLLNFYITACQKLYQATSAFLDRKAAKVPFLIAVAGSVAVGKSTTSRALKALLQHGPSHPKVDIVSTDSFLLPQKTLEAREITHRKGFPESYDLVGLLQFLWDLKSGKDELKIPVYSHRLYDILPDQYQWVCQPDIVIIEGLNVLQTGSRRMFISDFFDFSIFVDAEMSLIKQWFIERFMLFREKARQDPEAFFHQFVNLSDAEARKLADSVWEDINAVNLKTHILPFRERASLILEKSHQHTIQTIHLRRL